MTLQERLEALARGVEGAVGAALLGEDGVPLCQWMAVGAGVEVEAGWVECLPLVALARQVGGAEGGLEGLTVQAARCWTLVSVVDDRHHLVLSLAPGGNAGKGRYLLRLHAPEFRREVAALG
ncbi:MAG: hypothetical protein RL653_2305 [Pseudomonadota bacterium]